MVAVAAGLWRITPGSLVPDEDQGYYIAAVILPDGATLQRTDKVVSEVLEAIQSNPANEYAVAFTGLRLPRRRLPQQRRHHLRHAEALGRAHGVGTQQLVGELFMKTGAHQGGAGARLRAAADLRPGQRGRLRVLPAEPRRGRPAAHGAGDAASSSAPPTRTRCSAACRRCGARSVPQLYVDVDREKAKALGVPLDELYDTLAATLGTYYVNDFNKFGRTWQVLMSAEPGYRKRPDDIGDVYVRSEKGEMMPLARARHHPVLLRPRLARPLQQPAGGEAVRPGRARASPPARRSRRSSDRRRGAAARFQLRLGRRLVPGEELERHLEHRARPRGDHGVPDPRRAVREAGRCRSRCCWRCPSAPSARWRRCSCAAITNDVYFQIGLVTLLGLAAKNAILIVEYAVLKYHEGLSASAAALEAARLRFRPILMTSLAFIFGVLPLAFSTGAGAGARHSVGTGVMGGMLAATFLAIFFVPMFFKLLTDRHLTEKRSTDAIKDEAAQARVLSHRPVQAPHHAPRGSDAEG